MIISLVLNLENECGNFIDITGLCIDNLTSPVNNLATN